MLNVVLEVGGPLAEIMVELLRFGTRLIVVALTNSSQSPYPMDPGLRVRVRFWPLWFSR